VTIGWFAALVVPLLVLLYLLGRFDRAAAARDWDMLLSRATAQYIERWEEQARVEPQLAAMTFESAREAFERDEGDDARRLLAVSYGIFCGATEDRIVRLRGMAVCARMAAAFVPLAPIRAGDFRLRDVASLAAAGQVLHHFLVTGGERFVLRVRIVSFGLRLALRAMRRSKDGRIPAEWERFGLGSADWMTLDEAHIVSLKALMHSMAAERREREVVLFE
jgi:hypothetical protein